MDSGKAISNVIIENNTFNAVDSLGDRAEHQAAIAINLIEENLTGLPSLIDNLIIKNNFSNKYHGIYLSRNLTASPGIKVNAIIENNKVGCIAYSFGSSGSDSYNTASRLIIKNNFVKLICTFLLDTNTPTLGTNYTHSMGSVLIEGNTVNWLSCQHFQNFSNSSSLVIKNNNFSGDDPVFLDKHFGPGLGANQNFGINVSSAVYLNIVPYNYKNPIVVEGNVVDFGTKLDVQKYYTYAIKAQGHCKIINNYFVSAPLGYAMYCEKSPYTESFYYHIENNDFIRRSETILSYIKIDSENSSGKIINNKFDRDTVDGTNTNFIYKFTGGVLSGYDLDYWNIHSNKNQKSGYYLPVSAGSVSIQISAFLNLTVVGGNYSSTSSSRIRSPQSGEELIFFYNDTGNVAKMYWGIPLLEFLPVGVEILNIVLNHSANSVPSVSSSIQMSYKGLTTTETNSIGSWATGSNTLSLVPSSPNSILKYQASSSNTNGQLTIIAECEGASSSTLTLSVEVYFRYM